MRARMGLKQRDSLSASGRVDLLVVVEGLEVTDQAEVDAGLHEGLAEGEVVEADHLGVVRQVVEGESELRVELFALDGAVADLEDALRVEHAVVILCVAEVDLDHLEEGWP